MRSGFFLLSILIGLSLTACGTSPGNGEESRGSIVSPDESSTSDTQVQSDGIFCTVSSLQATVMSNQTFTVRVETSGYQGSYRIVNSSINGATTSTQYLNLRFTNTSGSAVTRKINVRVVDEASDTYLCSASVKVMPQ